MADSKLKNDYTHELHLRNKAKGFYKTPGECPVCYKHWTEEDFSGFFSQIEIDVLSECRHFICMDCFKNLQKRECPLCKHQFSPNFYETYIDSENESSDDERYEEGNENLSPEYIRKRGILRKDVLELCEKKMDFFEIIEESIDENWRDENMMDQLRKLYQENTKIFSKKETKLIAGFERRLGCWPGLFTERINDLMAELDGFEYELDVKLRK